MASIIQLGQELGINPPSRDQPQVTEQELRRIYARSVLDSVILAKDSWLFVYDNVEKPGDISDLIPSDPARLLITSRFSDWGELACEMPLGVLGQEYAVNLLLKRTGQRDDLTGASRLAITLGELPLALEHASAFIRRTPGLSFDDYSHRVQTYIEKVPRSSLYSRSVAATFRLSIERLSEECIDCRELMSHIAFLDPELIPYEILNVSALEQSALENALRLLSEYSIVKVFGRDISTHRLVQLATRLQLDETRSKKIIQQLALRLHNITSTRFFLVTADLHDSNRYGHSEYVLRPGAQLEPNDRFFVHKQQALYLAEIAREFNMQLPEADVFNHVVGRTKFIEQAKVQPNGIWPF